MDLLWPESSARAARNNLNVAIHGLRRSLEAGGKRPYVVFRDECYLLDPSLDVWIDVEEFAAARSSGHELRRASQIEAANECFEHAVGLYRGELFEDDAEGEWYLGRRRQVEEQFAEALELTAEHAYASMDFVACIDTCHRLLQVDPCRETTHRLLMHAYVAQNQHHLAARQYATCVSALLEHLDAAPQPETTATFVDLLRCDD